MSIKNASVPTLKTRIWILSDFDAEQCALSSKKQSFQCSSDQLFWRFFAGVWSLKALFKRSLRGNHRVFFPCKNMVRTLSSGDSLRAALRAVSKVLTQIWAFLKNLAFEESSSHSTTLSAKHSSIYLHSSSWKCAHFLRTRISCDRFDSFRDKSVQKICVHQKMRLCQLWRQKYEFWAILMQNNVLCQARNRVSMQLWVSNFFGVFCGRLKLVNAF